MCVYLQKVSEYEGILQAAKGSASEKKLAAGFITRSLFPNITHLYTLCLVLCRFYHLFPSLAETAMDTLLDLVEEENDMVRTTYSIPGWSPDLSLPQIRRTAIKALPDICKTSSEPALCTKISEYLTQLLATGQYTILSESLVCVCVVCV